MRFVLALAVASLLAACAETTRCIEVNWGYVISNEMRYAVNATATSPAGVRFDPTGQAISGAVVDRLTSEVEACLARSIDRTKFVVKVPSDWSVSCDGTQQVLSATAPERGCDAKGLSGPCPCRWRAFIQCPNVIVTTPSMYLYKDALVRWVLRIPDPWSDPMLAKCAAPSTEPLSLGGP